MDNSTYIIKIFFDPFPEQIKVIITKHKALSINYIHMILTILNSKNLKTKMNPLPIETKSYGLKITKSTQDQFRLFSQVNVTEIEKKKSIFSHIFLLTSYEVKRG